MHLHVFHYYFYIFKNITFEIYFNECPIHKIIFTLVSPKAHGHVANEKDGNELSIVGALHLQDYYMFDKAQYRGLIIGT